LETEKFLLSQEINIPVYFTPFTPELEEIYLNIKETTSKDSATSAAQGIFFLLWFNRANKNWILFVALLGAVFASGYQLAVNGNQAKLLTDMQISNIQVFSNRYMMGFISIQLFLILNV